MAGHAIDIDKLTTDERLDLIDALWTSLDDDDVPLTDAQQRELNRRLDRLGETGPTGSSLDEVMGRLRSRHD